MQITYEHYTFYGKPERSTVEVPDDTVFIYKDGDIGQTLHQGCNHYIGASYQRMKEKFMKVGSRAFDFDDLTFYILSDVKLITEIPLIGSDEFYNRFHLDKYLIIHYTEGYVNFSKMSGIYDINDNSIKANDPSHIDISCIYDVIEPRVSSYHKILSIEGPYCLKTLDVVVSSWIATCEQDILSIMINNYQELPRMLNDFHIRIDIKQDDGKILNDAINKVLNGTGYKTEQA